MANITITIIPGQDIPPTTVKHGDSVTFSLQGAGNVAVVTFDETSCLVDKGPIDLGGTHALQAAPDPVSPTARKGHYPYTVKINGGDEQRSKLGGNLEVKTGGIDVSTDPPKE